jgi:hypothetical protein
VPNTDDSVDEAFEGIDLYTGIVGLSGKHISETYLDWIKLMVVHFDVASILVSNLTKPGLPKLSIKILNPPPHNKNLLHWQHVLSHPNYHPLDNTFNTQEIIKFLDSAISDAKELVKITQIV